MQAGAADWELQWGDCDTLTEGNREKEVRIMKEHQVGPCGLPANWNYCNTFALMDLQRERTIYKKNKKQWEKCNHTVVKMIFFHLFGRWWEIESRSSKYSSSHGVTPKFFYLSHIKVACETSQGKRWHDCRASSASLPPAEETFPKLLWPLTTLTASAVRDSS